MRARHQEVDDTIQILALEVLHVLSSNRDARRHCKLMDGDVLRSVCAAIGFSATDSPKKPKDSRADITVLGLEILHHALDDVEAAGDTAVVLQSPGAIAFLDVIASEPHFVRSLCSTMLLSSKMKIKRHDQESDDDQPYDVPGLYGPPLVMVRDSCAGKKNTHEAAESLLFTVSVYSCAIESQRSEAFWKAALLEDKTSAETNECVKTGATFCAYFLKLLTSEAQAFIPADKQKQLEFCSLRRPLVRYRLLEALKDSMKMLTMESVLGHNEMDSYMLSLLVHFNVPHICLSVWKDPALLDLAFDVIKQMVEADPDEVLHLFVESKEAIMSLFDLLNLDSSTDALVKVSDIRRFLASTLGKLAESGMLTDAVERFDVRSSAIAALAAACLSEEEHSPGDDEELTSNRLASGLMQCLVELCTAPQAGEKAGVKSIRLSSVEAESIARNLGKKICHMVISRFLERAKLQQYEIEEDEDVMDAPDVAMLCAVAQHEKALQILRSIGGLHALAQVASEGELSAVLALEQGCKQDPTLLLEGDTYRSVMSLFSSDKEDAPWRSVQATREKVEAAAFQLLAQLCVESAKGQKAVATDEECHSCLMRALQVLSLLVSVTPADPDEPSTDCKKNGERAEASEDSDVAVTKSTEEDDGDDAVKKSTEENDGDETGKAPSVEENGVETKTQDALNEVKNTELIISAYTFLSSLVPVGRVRGELLKHDSFVRVSSLLIMEPAFPELQFEAVRVMAKLAPYVSKRDTLTSERLGQLLQAALSFEPTFKDGSSSRLNRNSMHVNATAGLQYIFDSLPSEMQVSILNNATSRYAKLLRTHTVARTSQANERENGGELGYHLTSLILLAKGKDSVEKCFNASLLVPLVNTIQWRYDPKTAIGDTEVAFWDATVTHCLQILSLVFWRDAENLSSIGITIPEIKKSVLMVARAGKAPRKAIDFMSALALVCKTGEAAANFAAQRIIASLSSDL
jgi:hypothetical protein